MSNVERLLLSAVEDPPDVDPQDLLVELNHQQISISGRLVARSGELRDGARAQSLALAEMDGSVSMLQEALAGMTVQASSAQKQASRATDAARSGRESVLENLRMMESMGASSKQIENLAKLLQSVAKQTRLLALNASIEAARVGEEGRGFAVIADEIRSLSDAAKDAVTEVSNLVKRTETWIDGGVELSRMVEANLAEISEAATDTASEVATIVSSAERQVDVADRTYRAVHEVVELVNSNLVVAEEIGDAGSLLQEKTEKIMSVAAEYYDV